MMNFNPFTKAFNANPYVVYAQARAMGVCVPFDMLDSYLFFSHAACSALLRNPHALRVIPQNLDQMPPEIATLTRMTQNTILMSDPPRHTQLRGLVHKAFTPRMVEHLREHTQVVMDTLLDKALAAGELDLIRDVAIPLPVAIIMEMVGLPMEESANFQQWSKELVCGFELAPTLPDLQKASVAALALYDCLEKLVDERRLAPKDDLLSRLIAAEEQGAKLGIEEIWALIGLLMVAAHETTMNLIGNGMFALLHYRDQWDLLKAQPELLPTAIEELLRYDSPLQMISRFASEDIELQGKHIPCGKKLWLVIGGANRDPAVFAEPDKLDITRSPNPHVAFGHGIHYCVGAPLARLEAGIAFSTLMRRLPDMRLIEQAPSRSPSVVFRGLQKLPVAY